MSAHPQGLIDPQDAQRFSLAEQLRLLPQADQDAWAAELTDKEAEALEYDWQFWGRPAQLEPAGSWLTWLILAGRGFGKTRTGCEWVRSQVEGRTPLARGKVGRIAIVAETAADARDVLAEGPSGLLAITPKAFRPIYEPSKRRLTWPNGATATLYNATEPDQLRGPEHEAALCDELAKWAYAQEAWDMLQFGLRIGNRPRVCVTTTPRPIALVKELVADQTTVITRGKTADNRNNLAPTFLKKIYSRYHGTRLGRQELDAEILDDVPGALWTRAIFDKHRVAKGKTPPMQRIVIAVDPSGASGKYDPTKEEPDDIGIVACGRGFDGRGYVLADRTMNAGPAEWGKRVANLFSEFSANEVVAEINFGGAMVDFVIRTADANIPVKVVHASRGKAVRAEPISALYEQGKISHVVEPLESLIGFDRIESRGTAALEDEMCQMTRDGYTGKGSPNRLDAVVWGLTELMLDDHGYDLKAALLGR